MDEVRLVAAACLLSTNDLTDGELAAMNICVQLGTDPRGVIGYDRAKALFTTEAGGIPQAHDVTKQAMAHIVLQRLKGGPDDGG